MGSEEGLSSNEHYIRDQLRYPDWYIRLEDYLRKDIFPVVHDDPLLSARRNAFYDLVSKMLSKNLIPLAQTGPDLDSERQPIDTVVIHHTEEDPNITLEKLSALGLIRQYAQRYLDNDVWGHKELRGKPIWSGHFRNGRMVFFAYHWLVRPDGSTQSLLEDSAVGRHALDLNPRSIGLSFSGNFEHSTPSDSQIEAASRVISGNYSFVDPSRILGHREVIQQRTCPGDQFLGGWKNTLLEEIKKTPT